MASVFGKSPSLNLVHTLIVKRNVDALWPIHTFVFDAYVAVTYM